MEQQRPPGAQRDGARGPGLHEVIPAGPVDPPAPYARIPVPGPIGPQFTVRAVITGMVLGGLLAVCNIYVGLKIGSAFSMSIVAALLGWGFWNATLELTGRFNRPFGILENNKNNKASSAAASVGSAGFVAPIPPLTLLTGQTLPWHWLALWVLSVMLVGIVVAIPLRRQMVVVERLPFPSGIASAEMLRELHARGSEATARVIALASAGLVAAGGHLWVTLGRIPSFALPFSIAGLSSRSLTLTLNPSLLLMAIGGLIGMRACASLLVGAVLAYGVLSPALVDAGVIAAVVDGASGRSVSYRDLNQWLLWPGVTLMVVASLVSVCFSWRSIVGLWRGGVGRIGAADALSGADDIRRKWLIPGIFGVVLLSVALQMSLFGISWWAALIGVLLAFALAQVAGRVAGETGLGAVGPMGKVAQLIFGVLVPKNPVPNLMAANVTGGAASQCADLLGDLKCGHLLGASPRLQTWAQICGALVGALVGPAAYLLLIPDPGAMLMTEEWAAPAVASWKAVAELFMDGLGALPTGAPTAIGIAAIAGVVLPILERRAPRKLRPMMLSPVSLGLAFVVPASLVLSMFIGGVIAWMLSRWVRRWSARFLVAICAGAIAGESLTGMGLRLVPMLRAWGIFP